MDIFNLCVLFDDGDICFQDIEMSNTDRDRERSMVGVRFPLDVREAIERAAARELCSASDIVRRATVEALRRAGLIEEPRP
jgi:hypothetical protein